ncbi:protein crumbs homolog 2-like [Mytilus californianus]|uniref:protein crumbs homolog 2-like n=1 Tax=Mytilus californianus TaxID=6549 RepID=UPI0022476385|nr:protein crumbs homolog 2-like [Mytilus californianus]
MNETFWTCLIASISLTLVYAGNGVISACYPNPCLNSGTCQDLSGGDKSTFSCTCTANYTGATCDQEITDSTDPGLSDGEIAGIVVGSVVLLVLIVVIAIIIWKFCCQKSENVAM